jgi:hypothetical protein
MNAMEKEALDALLSIMHIQVMERVLARLKEGQEPSEVHADVEREVKIDGAKLYVCIKTLVS